MTKILEYPNVIYATERVGSNGISCIDYRNFDEDVEYITTDYAQKLIKQAKLELIGEIMKHRIGWYGEENKNYGVVKFSDILAIKSEIEKEE